MDEEGSWRPSPAYDLTFADGPGGEHTMLIAGEGRAPTTEHLMKLARECELKHAGEALEQVRAAVDRFGDFAEQACVPTSLRRRVAAALG